MGLKTQHIRSYTVEELLVALWHCYELSGADTDGMTEKDGPYAIQDFPTVVVREVGELREEYCQALDELEISGQ